MLMGVEESEYAAGARLTIDLDALTANYRDIARRVAPARTAAVVKADAYGLGATRIVPALARAGCRDFFVAHLSEAIALRGHVPEDARLYILNGLNPGAEALAAATGAVPVLNALEQVWQWCDMAARIGRRLPGVIQIDSGMSRLGLMPEEISALSADSQFAKWIDLQLVMSHLACADEPRHPANQHQLQRFRKLAALLPQAPLSLANSGGCHLPAEFHLQLVRPGVALYGVAPHSGVPNPMRPVVHLDARVIQVRTIPPATGVGYGLTYAADTERRIATIAVGYADGWPRHLGNRGAAWFNGIRLPIVGRVSMDSITLDASALPCGALKPGDMVELIGPNQSLEMVAADAGTIAYEILTNLGRRYARFWIDNGTTASRQGVRAA